MLDIKFIRENASVVKENCVKRRVKFDVDELLRRDSERREAIKKAEELRALRKQGSKGKPTEAEISKMRALGEEIAQAEEKLRGIETVYQELMMQVPNLTHPETPIGGEADFRIIETNKEPPVFAFKPKDHEQIMLDQDLIDFDRGTKVAGAKFYFAKNDLVRLNQALVNYGIDVVTRRGYTLMETPDMAKNEILSGAGFNPRGAETQIYSLAGVDLSLIGTAEITVGGYHAGEVLDLSAGPKKYVALSHCFRTEAGAYGRTNKGLYRVHQFSKLEMFIYCRPEDSEGSHAELLEIEKEICDGLEIPYRVIDVASSDLGGPAYRKFDIEAWLTMNAVDGSQGGYGEITSASNCTDYQARRLNIKYKKADGSAEFVHTLNGTAVVMSRFPIAIVENFQQADGRVKVPSVLRPYLGKDFIG